MDERKAAYTADNNDITYGKTKCVNCQCLRRVYLYFKFFTDEFKFGRV